MAALRERIQGFFVRNSVLHLRGEPPTDIRTVVDLIDRFIDDRLAYDLEWDDFISWESKDAAVEQLRLRIADLEQMFFSASNLDRREGTSRLVAERNAMARLIGVPDR